MVALLCTFWQAALRAVLPEGDIALVDAAYHRMLSGTSMGSGSLSRIALRSPKPSEGAGVFVGWDAYADTLERMSRVADKWESAHTFNDFDALIRMSCADLVDELVVADHGVDKLCQRVADADFGGDRDKALERVKFAARVRPAAQYAQRLEAEFGYPDGRFAAAYVSTAPDGGLICSDDRFADPRLWRAVPKSESSSGPGNSGGPDAAGDAVFTFHPPNGLWYRGEEWYLPDKQTRVYEDAAIAGFFRDAEGRLYRDGAPADLSEPHFLTQLQLWRRLAPNGTFEFVHDGVQQWLNYDAASESWFDGDQWVSYEQVGQVRQPDPQTAAHEDRGAEAADTDADAWTQGLEKQIADLRAEGLRNVLAAIRAQGVTEEQVSDAEICDLFDERMREQLAAAGV